MLRLPPRMTPSTPCQRCALTRYREAAVCRGGSDQSIPRDLFDKMLAAKNFQSGLQMLRQIEFALFDMRLHADFSPGGEKTAQQLLDEIRKQVAVLFLLNLIGFPTAFHIFLVEATLPAITAINGRKCCLPTPIVFLKRVLAGVVVNPEAGARFRNEILAVGGSRAALESFIAFRGREPKIDALLRHHGMAPA